jgi:hypothetical protein
MATEAEGVQAAMASATVDPEHVSDATAPEMTSGTEEQDGSMASRLLAAKRRAAAERHARENTKGQ